MIRTREVLPSNREAAIEDYRRDVGEILPDVWQREGWQPMTRPRDVALAALLLVAITVSVLAAMSATGPTTVEGHVVEIHAPDGGPAWVGLKSDYPYGETVRVSVDGEAMDRFWDAYWTGERVTVTGERVR